MSDIQTHENDFDFERYYHAHMFWSNATFGPHNRTKGILEHLTKEIEEVRESPNDASEWADLIILAIDGAWRNGLNAQDIIKALLEKQKKNSERKWPDWRTRSADEAIEHIRLGEE